MTRPRGHASSGAVRVAVLTDDGLPQPGRAATDPEYVLCDHGYLRRGWCDECHADTMDGRDRADPWLTALRSRAHERRARVAPA